MSGVRKQGPDKVSSEDETDDQGVTLDILRVAKSISSKLTTSRDSCVESGVEYHREHLLPHKSFVAHSSSNINTMVGLQPTSAEAAMSGSEFTLETGLSREDSLSCTSAGEQEDGGHASQSSQTSHPQPNSAAKCNLSIKQKNTKSGKKAYVSKALVLSGSEDEGQAISVKPSARSSPVTSLPPSPMEIQSEKTDNLQMITCFESMR